MRTGIPLTIVVAEHHPLRSRDEELIQAAKTAACPTQVTFHISLDDPLLTNFGVGAIQKLFKQLGMAEDTCLSNSLITTAIRGAQEKLEKELSNDLPARSIEDWFKYNLSKR
jgi:preprotein translocase subunit SecA